ncbi:hypothetical protein FOPG_20057 [Fusarium oxysporum f. sp. conglutinans race 2 54008]|uniref:Uncharacterized protein n=1 Tax=Fusarium oxysporum f. sp. conglutinans race 2 54008 TaxID=1089457 RepID=X0GUS2_FUSOX|nr:hypothetical protein FOPG_20057 [Fusarium oxysporum f. sp. conglutinans race 2 54008]
MVPHHIPICGSRMARLANIVVFVLQARMSYRSILGYSTNQNLLPREAVGSIGYEIISMIISPYRAGH